jgi:hypothetical protein
MIWDNNAEDGVFLRTEELKGQAPSDLLSALIVSPSQMPKAACQGGMLSYRAGSLKLAKRGCGRIGYFLGSGSYPMSRAELNTTSSVLKLCNAAATNGLITPRAPTNIPPALTLKAIP